MQENLIRKEAIHCKLINLLHETSRRSSHERCACPRASSSSVWAGRFMFQVKTLEKESRNPQEISEDWRLCLGELCQKCKIILHIRHRQQKRSSIDTDLYTCRTVLSLDRLWKMRSCRLCGVVDGGLLCRETWMEPEISLVAPRQREPPYYHRK